MNKILCLLLWVIFLGSTWAPLPAKASAGSSDDFYFDIRQTPFSCYGSYMAIIGKYDKKKQKEWIDLNDMSGRWYGLTQNILRIEPADGDRLLPVHYKGTPVELTGELENGSVSIYFEKPRVLHLYVKDADLRLSGDWKNTVLKPVSSVYPNTYMIGNRNVVLTVKNGRTTYTDNRFLLSREDGVLDVVIEQYYDLWTPSRYEEDREKSISRMRKEFAEWDKKIADVPAKYEKGRKLASYINWASVYEPRDYIERHAMAMSKKVMNRVWSWDHCFNAMALMYHNPQLSWDQLMFPFDHQNPKTGSIPDAVAAKYMILGYVKPPIHGWTLTHLLKYYTPDTPELEMAYDRLSKWTEFWFTHRDTDNNGLPEYNHGYDTGWDNGTALTVGFPLESADLLAYLVLQMDELSRLAVKASRPKDAGMWKKRSDALLKRLVKEFWDGDKFITRKVGTGEINKESQSLMSYLPIVLGKRLPAAIRGKMISELKQEGYLLTPYGLASESPRSPFYKSDSYWQGPVWAPVTFIVADGLRSCGEEELAKKIAERFCDTCIAASCFAENFDAMSGAPLRDTSHTWTTSVFLIFAHEYLKE